MHQKNNILRFFFNAKKEPHSQQVFPNESFWLSLLGCPFISPLFPCCFMIAVFLEVAEAVVASGWDVQGGGRQGVALSRGRLFCRPLECEELQMQGLSPRCSPYSSELCELTGSSLCLVCLFYLSSLIRKVLQINSKVTSYTISVYIYLPIVYFHNIFHKDFNGLKGR